MGLQKDRPREPSLRNQLLTLVDPPNYERFLGVHREIPIRLEFIYLDPYPCDNHQVFHRR